MSKMTVLVAAATLLASFVIATPVAYVHGVFSFENHAPTASGDSYTLHGNGTVGSVLANDSDPDPGDTLTAVGVTNTTNGTITNSGYGNFNYTRNSSTWTGSDSFTYKACDASLCSDPVTVNITVTNQTPVAVGDSHRNRDTGGCRDRDQHPGEHSDAHRPAHACADRDRHAERHGYAHSGHSAGDHHESRWSCDHNGRPGLDRRALIVVAGAGETGAPNPILTGGERAQTQNRP